MERVILRRPLGISPGEWKVCETGLGPAVVAGPGEQGTKLVVSADGFSAQTKARRKADAHLVATAPMLLALVKRFVAGGDADRAESGLFYDAKRAIDQAHGRIG